MTAAWLVRGDARRLPLADKSVQVCVTSPPYFGLRNYGNQTSIWGGDPNCTHVLSEDPAQRPMTGGTGAASAKQITNVGTQFGNAWAEEIRTSEQGNKRKPSDDGVDGRNRTTDKAAPRQVSSTTATCTICGAWKGELGSEPTPGMFVAHLVEVFVEVKRVLRDDGVCFLNIGDSYASHDPGGYRKGEFLNGPDLDKNHVGVRNRAGAYRPGGTPPKSLLLVPERLAIALSDDGWIIRSRIAWCKAAPMPESTKDRPTSAWEHIWVLTKRGKYYWDQEAVREPYSEQSWSFDADKNGTSARAELGLTSTPKWQAKAAGAADGRTDLGQTAMKQAYAHGGRNLWNYWEDDGQPQTPDQDVYGMQPNTSQSSVFADEERDDRESLSSVRGTAGVASESASAGEIQRVHAGIPGVEEGSRVDSAVPCITEGEGLSGTEESAAETSQETDSDDADRGGMVGNPGGAPMEVRLLSDAGATADDGSRHSYQQVGAAHEGEHCACVPPVQQPETGPLNYAWKISPDPYPGAHFATFPRAIPERCIKAATSEYGACAACGAPWRRVVDREQRPVVVRPDEHRGLPGERASRQVGGQYQKWLDEHPSQTIGWEPTCRCGPAAGVRPCVVLDPFSGSGTTAFVAASLGRKGIGIDLSAEYIEQARTGRLAQEFLPL